MKSIYAVVGLVLGDCAEDNFSIGVGKRYSIKQYRLVDIADGDIIDVDKSDYKGLLGSNEIYFEDTDLLSFTHVDVDMLLGLDPEAYVEVHGKMISMHKMRLTPGYNFCYSFVIDGKTVCKDSNRYMLLGVQKLDYEITMRLVYDHKNGSIFINICGLGIEPFNIGYCSSYPIDDLNLIGKMNSLINNVRCESLGSLLDSLQILSNGCIYINDICILTSESGGDIIISNDTKTIVMGDINRKVNYRLNSLVVPPSVENVIYSEFGLGRFGSSTKLYLSNKLSSDTIDKICDAVLGLDSNKLDDVIRLDDCVEFY